MNKKGKNVELKIYELLGVKIFRKMVFKIAYISLIPYNFKMTKEERLNMIYNTPSNYIMKKGNGIQDLIDFKKELFSNAKKHIISLLFTIPILLNFTGSFLNIIIIFMDFINIYCIILQRYNTIRINQVIEKWRLHEKAKKSKLKDKLIEEKSLFSEHAYKNLVNTHENADKYYDLKVNEIPKETNIWEELININLINDDYEKNYQIKPKLR